MISLTWKLVQTSEVEGTVQLKNVLTLHTSHKFGSPQATLTYDDLATKSEVPLNFNNSLG